jgi:DHA2 family multidrug resistance protein-like MFS transporter
MEAKPSAPAGAGGREWLGLAVLALATMLTMLDNSVLFLALPHLTADLDATATQQLWITDGYGFLIAGFLVTMGTLGDRVGRRRVLLFGAAAFGVVSVVAAFSSSAEMLIACRAALGIAGATIMPSTLALITAMFPRPKEQGVAIGVWATALTGGIALGPIVGGLLLEWFWWGAAFLIGVPVMLLLLLLTGPFLLPRSTTRLPGRLDPLSVALSLGAMLPLVYGIKEIARTGWEPSAVLAVMAGAVVGVAFVLRQRRLSDPLLDVRLFSVRVVRSGLVLSLLVAAVQAGTGFFVVQFLQLVKGLSPLEAGLWVLVPTLCLIVGIFVSQALVQRFRPAYVVGGGAAVAAVGTVVLAQASPTSSLLVLLAGLTTVYVGVSPVGPLLSRLVVPAAPPQRAGSAASLLSTSGELGVALGIAILGSVGTLVYRANLTIPSDVTGPAAAKAGETIAGALSTAQGATPDAAAALVASAQSAFTSGLNLAAIVGGVTFAALAVLAAVSLRHIPPMTPPPAQPADPKEVDDLVAA